MAEVANRGSIFLPHLYDKIEDLPSQMQEEVLLFTDFLLSKNMALSHNPTTVDFGEMADDNYFANLSLSSLSKEWNTEEDEEWNTILAQMPSIQ
jgi:hypothetical protein